MACAQEEGHWSSEGGTMLDRWLDDAVEIAVQYAGPNTPPDDTGHDAPRPVHPLTARIRRVAANCCAGPQQLQSPASAFSALPKTVRPHAT